MIVKDLPFIFDAQYAADNNDDGMRTHLGGSAIGGECMREVWFGFKWADSEQFDGRMLRLFDRGHREEQQFAALLRRAGATVWTENENGSQFRISAFGGHAGGACDGVAINIPSIPNVPTLLEMKTHNDKQFKALVKDGVRVSHPKHVKQAQFYMRYLNLTQALYCAVNKNDDHLHFELIPVDSAVGYHLESRAETIIFSDHIPPRISETPSHFKCRFCSMAGVCHGSAMPRVNCRTCAYSKAERDGTWSCAQGCPQIKESPKVGCAKHIFNPEMFPHATVENVLDGTVTYRKRSGGFVMNGPEGEPSSTFNITQ